MKLSYAHVIDALSSFELEFQTDAFDMNEVVERVELYTGCEFEQGILYIRDGIAGEASDGIAEGTTVEAVATLTARLAASGTASDTTSGATSGAAPGAASETAILVHGASAAEVMNAISRYQAAATSLLDEMRTCYYIRNDLQGLCETLAEFVGNPVLAYDDALLPVAQTAFPRDFALKLFGTETLGFDYAFKTIPDWSRDASADPFKREGAQMTQNPDGSVVAAVCNIMSAQEFQGFMEIFQVNKPITHGEMLLLEQAASIVCAPQPFGENSFILSHLKGKPGNDGLTASWLSALKWRPDDGIYVVALDLPFAFVESKVNMNHVMRMVRALIPNSVNVQMEETPVIVANERLASRTMALVSAVPMLVRAGADIRVGVSEVMTGIGNLHEGYTHAQFAAQYARKLGGEAQVMLFEECRFAFFSDLCDLKANRDLVLDAKVARMFADDIATGSENVRTIKHYIEAGFNLNATAQALSVHRNTAAYRLKHACDRYGLDLSSPITDSELVFQVLLSCKLLLESTP